MKMYKVFPEEYNFFPKTWILPHESMDLRNHWTRNSRQKRVTYIVKPDCLSQGQGIFLSTSVEQIFELTMNVRKIEETDEPE